MAKPFIGYTLSSEEHHPQDLINNAKKAEQAGFDFLSISDHIFPWVDQQGQSGFVWSTLAGISRVTERIPIMTGVTCPLIRIHPVIIAHAAATTASLLENRFMLGLGTGENLNEHVVGAGWPNIQIRQEMLSEAIEIIRLLWQGDLVNYIGAYYTVDQAKIYTLPQNSPPIFMAAGGPESAKLAGKLGDGLISTSADSEITSIFDKQSGQTKDKYVQISACYDSNVERAKQTAAKIWPNAGIQGQASQELPMPAHFEQLAASLTTDQITQSIVCGPNPQDYLDKINQATQAGFTHIYIHQIGPNQQEFIEFYQSEIQPSFQ